MLTIVRMYGLAIQGATLKELAQLYEECDDTDRLITTQDRLEEIKEQQQQFRK